MIFFGNAGEFCRVLIAWKLIRLRVYPVLDRHGLFFLLVNTPAEEVAAIN